MTDFAALGLSAQVLRALDDQNFTTPTAIQSATIPALMNGNDVIGVAQTGGGKTAAFVLPMLERLILAEDKPKPGMPRALILAPTRELAMQITRAIQDLARFTQVKCCTIYGGAPYRTQIHILRRGVDILVATPGRLMDHMKQGNIYLDETGYFVLDEADRMLDMGFVDDVRIVSSKLPVGHQSVMFSATMNHAIKGLANTLLKEPEHIQITPQATIADNLTHKVMFTARETKTDLLLHMLEEKQVYKALIFTRTKREADELSDVLIGHGLKADAIHGDKQQRQRQRIIQNFRDDRIDFLVATDVAARGIDIQDVTHVFNTDVPVEAESYVHRIGRTARGGQSGTAYTFCSRGEIGLLRAVERLIKEPIEVDEDNPFPQAIGKRREHVRPEHRGGGKRFEGNRGKADGFRGKRREATGDKRDSFRGKRKEFDGEKAGKFQGKRKEFDGEKPSEFRGKRKEFDSDKPKEFRAKRRDFDGEKSSDFRAKRRDADGDKSNDFRGKRKEFTGDKAGKFQGKRKEFDGEKSSEFRGKRKEFDGDKPKEFRAKRRDADGEKRDDFKAGKPGGFKGKRNEEGRGKKPFKAGKDSAPRKKTATGKGPKAGGKKAGGDKVFFKKRAA
ncbi:DEAD/DEAH box helicase [Kordiimonas marina]|uniref:DEAD/DEAH box helicase n=1 Tax=Kordiimonas marina TaxID=2872312 RepID=UPI001FF1102B|nr:DEAD/DEAH box helicase [Kordiimonas marina]MCJ9428135.1 DEAD/DEAH box helicase [Kordiimonas marina]